jgi:UDP-glucose:(heptosyl)LPS alpha-1,3-glucosyltransferase
MRAKIEYNSRFGNKRAEVGRAAADGGAFRVSPTMALPLLFGMPPSKDRSPVGDPAGQPAIGSGARLTIGLVRRGHSETGGAEAYLKRLAHGLSRAGHATRLFTDASWPPHEWRWGAMTRLRGETPRRFADELEKAAPKDHCDLLLSLERVWRCDVYRAGDGIHQAWLRRRDEASSPTRKLLRKLGRSHRDTLDLEEALFTGGTRWVIANSRMVKNEAQQFYSYPATQIEVIPNGVPLADFRVQPEARELRRRNLGLTEDDMAVLFVGSGWGRKGLRYAIEAVSLGKNLRLLVAGRGRRRPTTARRIRLLGAVRDLPILYAAADIFLLPTLYDPFSNGCLEALASGLPVITTRANGFSEIIEDGVHGTIVEHASDVPALRRAVGFWSDAQRRQNARQAILERAGQFDISVNVERTLAVLRQAASASAVVEKIRKT